MSERVTWESCPSCGERAAVGWIDQTVIEVACIRECALTAEQIAYVRLLSSPPPAAIRGEP